MFENTGLHSLTKKHAPQIFRNRVRSTIRSLGDVYAGIRGLNPNCALPDFLIVGAQKAGTTSLFNWLVESGFVQTPLFKEIGYFDSRWHWPIKYRGYFKTKQQDQLVGEATPSYLAFPEVPERVFDILGANCKIVIVLRDPVDRAVSHYYHECRLGFEKREMYRAMSEADNLINEAFEENTSASRRRYILKHYSYIYRSEYSERLRPWFEKFDRTNISIIKSEDMFRKPRETVGSVADFLGMKVTNPAQFIARNTNSYVFEDSKVASYLRDRLESETIKYEEWNY